MLSGGYIRRCAIKVAIEVRNNQTCFAAAVTTFLRKFRTPAMIDPMIPGSAVAALPASLPRSRARALSLFFTHSLTLLGCFGGFGDPPAPAPPVRVVTIVEMIKSIEVNTAVMVRPCSLKTSLSFSRRLRSSSRIFSTVCHIQENWEANSLRFCDKSCTLAARSSFRSAIFALILSSCT